MKTISNKKVLVLFLSLIMLLGVSGCSLNNVTSGYIEENKVDEESFGDVASAIGEPNKDDNEIEEQELDGVDKIATQLQKASKDKEEMGTTYFKFIDVGQGDSCFIITPNSEVILIDTGDNSDASEILDVMDDYIFEDIDYIFLTHPHKDHIGGTEKIMETYSVSEIVMPSYVSTSKTYEGILEKIESEKIDLIVPDLGYTFNVDGLNIQVVGIDSLDDSNNSSLVLRVSYGTTDILFTGDLEKDGEDIVIKNGFPLDAEILKVGHHGSDTSSSLEFLDVVQPQIGIISVGEDNKYGHPSDEVIDRLILKNIQYFCTNDVGTITIETNGSNILYSLDNKVEVVSRSAYRGFEEPQKDGVYVEVRMEPEEILKEQFNIEN